MNEVIRDIFMKDGMPPEIADMMIAEMPEDQQCTSSAMIRELTEL